jgi:glycosyltransferase involved in cell wall biosynthesis
MIDFKFAQKPDLYIANSKNVANRIRKFYRRESSGSVSTHTITNDRFQTTKKDYFLIVSRIIGSKNIELAVAAANKYGFKLKIAGKPIGTSGEDIAAKISGPTVEYLGEVDEKMKVRLLSEAKAFLALEKDPDFGMTAVEPQFTNQ